MRVVFVGLANLLCIVPILVCIRVECTEHNVKRGFTHIEIDFIASYEWSQSDLLREIGEIKFLAKEKEAISRQSTIVMQIAFEEELQILYIILIPSFFPNNESISRNF